MRVMKLQEGYLWLAVWVFLGLKPVAIGLKHGKVDAAH